MDLLIEKLDGRRYYLSQYKVLITDFEESAPSVTRNSKQLDQRNGNIDFGGWHTDKTINITGYYRADDIDEEETLREKLYALLSDPDGYYITQLKTTPSVAMERPGETSGSYYDKLSNYPSHKRFLVYTESPEVELVGNVNGTLLYKLTAEFKTMKLPYGGSVPQDLDVKSNVPYYGRNYFLDSKTHTITPPGTTNYDSQIFISDGFWSNSNRLKSNNIRVSFTFTAKKALTEVFKSNLFFSASPYPFKPFSYPAGTTAPQKYELVFNITDSAFKTDNCFIRFQEKDTSDFPFVLENAKLEIGTTFTDWSPAPEDQDYNEWYLDTYYNTNNLFIPYAGTVPCNQLEQGFAIEMTAKGAASSLSFKIDDTELTYSGAVASGDVFMFSGFSYTQNGLSIVSKTNKAYFVLQPDKPNRITCNVPGIVRIIGFQNLYA